MDFGLSEEQELLQSTVRQLLENECGATRLREIFEAESDDSGELWGRLCELGIAGLAIPDVHGGAGLELLDLALVAEELGRAAAPGPFLGHALAALAITWGGSPEQQARWLPGLATGDLRATVAFAEGGETWQPEEWTLPAGDSITGTKNHVPGALGADLFVVGTAGGGLALVPAGDGVETKPVSGVDRTRRLHEVSFHGARAEVLAQGRDTAARVRDAALVLLAADAWGGADRCLEMCVAYAGDREQFGVTLGHFQAYKHQLANMALEIEPARALVWYAAHALDHVPDEAPRQAALAKAHLTEVFMQVARDSVEAHGGIGFTWECDVQIWFKRALFDRAWLGTPETHRDRSASLAGW